MFKGVISIRKDNLDLVLAKILIKEKENSAQLSNCGINYFKGGLLSYLWGNQNSVSKKWF